MDEQKDEVKTYPLPPRDKYGHFVHIPKPGEPPPKPKSTQPLHPGISISKTHDYSTLLDVHVGNPLRRITQLLEEIKKQKAFSFTLKGSLGVMGIVLVVATFGIFSGSKAFCDKGIQSKIGIVKILQIKENVSASPFSYFANVFFPQSVSLPSQRIILLTHDSTIHIDSSKDSKTTLANFSNESVIATGVYDACSQNLKIEDKTGVEKLQ